VVTDARGRRFRAWAEVPGLAVVAGLPEATEGVLRDLARAVSSHRRAGGALDDLPSRRQELPRAMDEAQRRFFLEEPAKADAEGGKDRFRAALGRWRDRRQPGDAGPDPDSEGVP
jgi:hypothetical protein